MPKEKDVILGDDESRLPGTWEMRHATSGIDIYASWDAQLQFMTKKGAKTTANYKIALITGKVDAEGKPVLNQIVIRNCQTCEPEVVRIYWPNKSMPMKWCNPKQWAAKEKERLEREALDNPPVAPAMPTPPKVKKAKVTDAVEETPTA